MTRSQISKKKRKRRKAAAAARCRTLNKATVKAAGRAPFRTSAKIPGKAPSGKTNSNTSINIRKASSAKNEKNIANAISKSDIPDNLFAKSSDLPKRKAKRRPSYTAANSGVLRRFRRLVTMADVLCLLLIFGFISAIITTGIYAMAKGSPEMPAADPVKVVSWAGGYITPEDFVSNITGEEVTVSFQDAAPDTKTTGRHTVTINLKDKHGNITTVISMLNVYDTVRNMTFDIGTDISHLTVADFIEGKIHNGDIERFALDTDISAIDTSYINVYPVIVLLSNTPAPAGSTLNIGDLTPPEATVTALERWTIDDIKPEEFITEIIDETEVTVSFYTQPDMSIIGEQEVNILLRDEGGNETALTAYLTLRHDDQPPYISGDIHKSVCIGETILYRNGVTVTDNLDEEVPLDVDISAVNAREAGVYPVIYSATDRSGNTATVEGSLTVYNVTIEMIDETMNAIIDRILTDDMTPREKAYAVFQYVRANLRYGSGHLRGNVSYTAYRAVQIGIGDCYYFYALSEELLTRAGIENIPIKRSPGFPTNHYWNLVNLGEGWFHFDALTGTTGGFMFTDSEAEKKTRNVAHQIPGFYVYDKSLYPEVVP